MVLSPSNTKPPDEGDNITTNTQHSGSPLNVSRRPTKVLYSKIHQRPAKTRESLIHTKPIVTSSMPSSDIISRSSNENSPAIIDTVYWGVSQTPGSLFFDITSRKESDRAIYKLAKSQFLDYVDLVVHKSGSSRYLEINFDKDQIRSKALEDGFHFDNGQTIIRPVLACRPGSTIRRLTLQRLPWLRPQQLLEGLKHTLSNYGYVRDVGIVTDSDTGAFLGSGYAVLDCTTDPSQPDPFLDLSHVMPWVDPHKSVADEHSVYIHVYWKEMPTYCKYCHELGHSATECKQAPSNKRVCYYCCKPGHIRVQCPDKISPAKRPRGSHKSKSTIPLLEHTIADTVKTIEIIDNQTTSTTPSVDQGQLTENQVVPPKTIPIIDRDTINVVSTIPSNEAVNPRQNSEYLNEVSQAIGPIITTDSILSDTEDVPMSDVSEHLNEEGSHKSQWANTFDTSSLSETDKDSPTADASSGSAKDT